MTSTTFVNWNQGLDAVHAAAAAKQQATVKEAGGWSALNAPTRRLGGALLAAVAAAVMVGASSLLAGDGQSGGALTWLALWIVGFATLLIFARAAFAAAGRLQAGWMQYRTTVAHMHDERELARVAQLDPRLWRELQVMRDRAAWNAD